MSNFNSIGSGVSEPQVAENRHLSLTGGIALTTVYALTVYALTCYTVIEFYAAFDFERTSTHPSYTSPKYFGHRPRVQSNIISAMLKWL